ncbi:MAG: hypothetical protein ACM32E_26275 [Gemmatimonadota bacterium]
MTGTHDTESQGTGTPGTGTPGTGTAAATAPAGRAGTSRWAGGLMLAEAVTFGVASYLHLQGRIPLGFTTITGEHFPDAATPEAVIGAVVAAGALLVLAAPGRARRAALGVTGFAILGVAVGLAAVIGRSTGNAAADLTYHALIMVALLVTFAVLLLRPGARPG